MPLAAAVALAAVCLTGGVGASTIGVVAADTSTDVFVNSIYMAPNNMILPVLPMNDVRRHASIGAQVDVVPIRGKLSAGDVLAVRVEAPSRKSILDGLVRTGVIAAIEDGTMTTSEWRCTDNPWLEEDWHSKKYDDSAWSNATEQALDCCPWRDPEKLWKHFAARWIGVASSDSDPLAFYCRYRVPEGSRLAPRFTALASAAAPRVNIENFLASSSQVQVSFTVDRAAIVSCNLIDARYKLRPPIAFELQQEGVTTGILSPNITEWRLLGSYFTKREYDAPAVARKPANSVEQCMDFCDAEPLCSGITFYEVGVDIKTGTNCKLVAGFDANKTLAHASVSRFTHMYTANVEKVHAVSLTGMVLPGTIYDAYCSARDPLTAEHSTWEVVSNDQYAASRTPGCLDCGAATPPIVRLQGGWASATEFIAVVSSSKAGRIFCAAAPALPNGAVHASALVRAAIKDAQHTNFLAQGGSSVPITISGLAPATRYEIACLADSEGGIESTAENLEASRRHWRTEAIAPPITTMKIQPQVLDGILSISIYVQMSARGLLWCKNLESRATRQDGIPDMAWLKAQGNLQRVEYVARENPGGYEGLNPNTSFEVYCTAEENDPRNSSVTGGGEMQSPFPVVAVLDPVTAIYDVIRVLTKVSKGPASVFCLAMLWSYTTEEEPAPPTVDQMAASPFAMDLFERRGGTVVIEIRVPYIGSIYDVYCYASEYLEPAPVGAEQPPRMGMSDRGITATRRTVQTVGASFKNDGWLCVSGNPCNITDLRGPPMLPLKATHRILARGNPCPGHCYCSGTEDSTRKGAWCSRVSHDRLVVAPFRDRPDEVGRTDPRGRWCYVREGTCFDQEPSPTYPDLWISYAACTFNLTAGRQGSGPPGFPHEGLASPIGSTGRTFTWGSSNVIVEGKAYHLCWCDLQTSTCSKEVDFRLSLGRLHVAGPSARQLQSSRRCIAGLPCSLQHLDGHALEDRSRLVVLEDGPRGCAWRKRYPQDPPGVVGFPRGGVSLPATDTGRSFSWGAMPVLASAGRYVLCWCGRTGHIDGVGGGTSCPSVRPDSGAGFLAPAGHLTVTGPKPRTSPVLCSLGLVCAVEGVQGVGIQGGDQIIVTSGLCGQPSPPPDGWAAGIDELEARGAAKGWLDGGWLRYGPKLSGCTLRSVGAPTNTTCGHSHEDAPDFSTWNASSSMRGLLGLPNRGISEVNTQPGLFVWGGPTWAFAGDYRLCWCASLAPDCSFPEHFRVSIGMLRLEGPAVLPLVSQVHLCIRGKACSIRGFQGRMPWNSQLFIAAGICTGPAPPGVPNQGISLPSLDSTTYSWGPDPIMLMPGKYRLCWCPKVGFCHSAWAFGAFAGILQVKGLLGGRLYVHCTLGQPCNTSGLQGEGLQNGDEVRVLTVCGHGVTPKGFEGHAKAIALGGGTRLVLPLTRLPGSFSLCWCPAGDPRADVRMLCSKTMDYRIFLGTMEVGGPEAGALYTCYEWLPCSISRLQGTALHDGDRLLLAPPGTDCAREGGGPVKSLLEGFAGFPPREHPSGRRRRWPHAATEYFEFPQAGVTAPGTGGGLEYTWGPGLVRSPPGIYTLCWCNHLATPGGCTERGPFLVPAGSLRIGTFVEHAYQSRPPDPEARPRDSWFAFNLSWPLPLLFCLTIMGGWRKQTARQAKEEQEPENDPLYCLWPRQTLARIAQAQGKHKYEISQVQESRVLTLHRLQEARQRLPPPDFPDFGAGKDAGTAAFAGEPTQHQPLGRAGSPLRLARAAAASAAEDKPPSVPTGRKELPSAAAGEAAASTAPWPPRPLQWERPPTVPSAPAPMLVEFEEYKKHPEVYQMLRRQ